jgi:hypothetical protein
MTSTTTGFPPGIKIIGYTRRGKRAPQQLIDFTESVGGELQPNDYPRKCDLAIIWGQYNPAVEAHQKLKKKPFLLMEYGYYGDQKSYTSLNYNGMHGCGTRPPPGIHPRPQPELRPWRDEKGAVLLCGHVPGDTMCRRGISPEEWYARIIPDIRSRYPGRRIIFRLHPRTGNVVPDGVDDYHDAADVPLEEAVRGVEVAYNYGSTVDVKLVCLGVPCASLGNISMVGNRPYKWDRTAWAHWISYCRWSLEELKDGTAARHIAKGYVDARESAALGQGCNACDTAPGESHFMHCT